METTTIWRTLVFLIAVSVAPLARAQFAVIDAANISQMLAQAQVLEAQLATAHDHLAQAQHEFQSISGPRGMERLLTGVTRNYLPKDWSELDQLLQGADSGGRGSTLSTQVQAAAKQIAALSPSRLAGLTPAMQRLIGADRSAAALAQVVARAALAATSERFAALQQLIDAIHGATDQKAVLDLQARIGAEQNMLQNEQTKLQVLYQASQANRWASEAHEREQSLAWQGQFDTRFRPTP